MWKDAKDAKEQADGNYHQLMSTPSTKPKIGSYCEQTETFCTSCQPHRCNKNHGRNQNESG